MRRSSFERRLRDELHSTRPPRAVEAERRAWHVVEAAHSERSIPRRGRRGVRLAVALGAAALVLTLALTPAGARMGDWIGEVVSPDPEVTRSALASLPAQGRLLVVSESGPWIVRDDGARRRLGSFSDASWSPGGLYVVAARGRRLTALEPTSGAERWTLVAAAPVATPRWSPDGYRIAYRSGSDLFVTVGDNTDSWLLSRAVQRTPPAWRPGQAPNHQVLAYARGRRVHISEVDPADGPRRLLGRTPPGPVPRELWWSTDGRRLIAVGERSVRTLDARGRVLRVTRLPRGLRAGGSALDPRGQRLALIAAARGARSSELLVVRTDRDAPPRRRLGGFGPLEGLTWSIDGRVLVAGLPQADQWLFLRLRGRGGFVSVKGIRRKFRGGLPARTGSFPRPAGWCYAEPPAPGASSFPACSTGSAP